MPSRRTHIRTWLIALAAIAGTACAAPEARASTKDASAMECCTAGACASACCEAATIVEAQPSSPAVAAIDAPTTPEPVFRGRTSPSCVCREAPASPPARGSGSTAVERPTGEGRPIDAPAAGAVAAAGVTSRFLSSETLCRAPLPLRSTRLRF